MKTEVIRLRDERPVTLATYVLDLSPQVSWERRPAVIVCPGGGLMYTSNREAEPVAAVFLSRGYHAFVLRYTTADMGVKKVYPDILYDLAKTVAIVRSKADEWGVDANKMVIVGFSAGGLLAAMYSTQWHRDWLAESLGVSKNLLKPNAVVLAYPAGLDFVTMYNIFRGGVGPGAEVFHTMASLMLGSEEFTLEKLREISPVTYVDSNTPPTFIWTTADDSVVPVESILSYAHALAANKVPFELHVFASGVHGLSLADKTTARTSDQINPHVAKWIDLVLSWLQNHVFKE
ncbi:alpha/beta hydrolase [Ignisphaera sp. 4213-co]|uniref:Alpha/beta hydrolase n=1 Tax=Ignisphaera cupida TaxID=3050454 RepID=A0ABD4Z690_9CREN|nr:alpha/beta hydrolase [Ignisphaera sp. 4213-co]MDK6028831.1 alpha/beta hydrolase [Ignisphaera sp. 4213-co]